MAKYTSTLEHHQQEAVIANDPLHPGHIQPPIKPHHKRILDIGCGAGQTLSALGLGTDVTADGIDIDEEAVRAGNARGHTNITLRIASAESIPVPDDYYDFVYSRVALPYTYLDQSLREVKRVLATGGEAWFVLHSSRMWKRRCKRSLKNLDVKDAIYSGAVLFNSLLFHIVGRQVMRETFQTTNGIRKAIRRAGLDCSYVQNDHFFTAKAVKRAPDISAD